MRCNSRVVKSTVLNCTVQWFAVCTKTCTVTSTSFQNMSTSPGSPAAVSGPSHSPSPAPRSQSSSCLRGRPAPAGSHTRWRRAGFSHWVSRRLGPARCRVPVPRPFWWLSSIPLGACSTSCCRIHQLGRAGFLRSLAIMSQAAINAVHRFLSVHCFKFSWGYTWPRNRRVPRRLCV